MHPNCFVVNYEILHLQKQSDEWMLTVTCNMSVWFSPWTAFNTHCWKIWVASIQLLLFLGLEGLVHGNISSTTEYSLWWSCNVHLIHKRMFCLDIVILHSFDVMQYHCFVTQLFPFPGCLNAEEGGKVGVLKYVWRKSQWMILIQGNVIQHQLDSTSIMLKGAPTLNLFEWKLSFAMVL